RRGGGRDDGAIDHPVETSVGEHCCPIVQQRRLLRKPDGRNRHEVVDGLDRRDDRPIERRQQESEKKPKVGNPDEIVERQGSLAPSPATAFGSHQADSGRSIRLTRNIISTAVRARNNQLPAVACPKWKFWNPV